jgi:hypothetical protein
VGVQALAFSAAAQPGELTFKIFAAGEDWQRREPLFQAAIANHRLHGGGEVLRLFSALEIEPSRQGLLVELVNEGEDFVFLLTLDLIEK